MKISLILITAAASFWACNRTSDQSDAYGNFEAVETIVSAQATGMLETFTVEEGKQLNSGESVGLVDTFY
jgi:HlyD family secretion protein